MSKIGNNNWAQNCSQYLNFFRLSELCLLLMKPLYLIFHEDTTLGNRLIGACGKLVSYDFSTYYQSTYLPIVVYASY